MQFFYIKNNLKIICPQKFMTFGGISKSVVLFLYVLYVKSEKNNVSVCDNIVLAFASDKPLFFCRII
jgi:hypothetical protein